MRERNIRRVEATGDIGVVDEWDELFVGAAGPVAVCFAKVDIDESFVLDRGHCGNRARIWHFLDPVRMCKR